MALAPILTTSIDTTAGTFTFTDGSDYVTAGVDKAHATGAITIVGPNTVQYKAGSHAPADIDPDVSLVSSAVQIPTGSDGNFIEGVYKITYEIIVVAPSPVQTVSATFDVDFCKDAPEVVVTWVPNCLNYSILEARDTSTYQKDGVQWTLNSRTMTLSPPPEQNLSAYVNSTLATNFVNTGTDNVWSGTWGINIAVQIQKSVSGGGTVICDLVYKETFDLVCDSLCTVRCCLESLKDRMLAEEGTNSKLYDKLAADYSLAMAHASAIWIAEQCGTGTDINESIQAIKDITDCKDDCGDCDPSTPNLIIPPGGGTAGGVLPVVLPGTAIAVSYVAPNYTVSVDPDFFAKWQSGTNAVVVSSDSSITVTPTVTAATPTTAQSTSYDLIFPGTDSLTFDATLTFSGGVPQWAIANKMVQGNSLNNSIVISPLTAGPYPALNACSQATAFMATGIGGRFNIQVEIIDIDPKLGTNCTNNANPGVRVYDRVIASPIENSTFDMKFFDETTGGPVTWGVLDAFYNSVVLGITLTAT